MKKSLVQSQETITHFRATLTFRKTKNTHFISQKDTISLLLVSTRLLSAGDS